jgi:hypothetical protein
MGEIKKTQSHKNVADEEEFKTDIPMEIIAKKYIKLHPGFTFGNDKIIANRHNRNAYGISYGKFT